MGHFHLPAEPSSSRSALQSVLASSVIETRNDAGAKERERQKEKSVCEREEREEREREREKERENERAHES
jgi:hypothetical protein